MVKINHDLLRQLVEIPSPSGCEKEISLFCQAFLRKAGFQVETVPIGAKKRARENILATKGTGKKVICFYGHLDTVKATDKDWDEGKPPLKLTQVGDKYYGLGTADMKSGLWAIMQATRNTNKYVKVVFTVDEEEISEGAWVVVQKRPDFFNDVELLVAAESESTFGGNAITVGRPGRQLYKTSFTGQAEHLMHQERGKDAIRANARFMGRFYDLVDSGTFFKSPYSKAQIREINGASIGLSVPANSQAEIEIIQGPEDPKEEIVQKLRSIIGEGVLTEKLRKTPYLSGYHTRDFPYQSLIGDIIKTHTGLVMDLHVRSSVGDENVFATLGIPVITWGASGGNEHRSNEYIEIASLDKICAMYKDLLERI